MKITETKTIAGEWYEFDEPVTEDDLLVTQHGPEYSTYSNGVRGDVVFYLSGDAQKEAAKAQGGINDVFPILRYTPLAVSGYNRDDRTDISQYKTWREASKRVKLRGVRKEETKQERIQEAVEEVRAKLDPNSDWYREQIADVLKEINEGVQRFIDESHQQVLENYQRSLSWDDHWVEYVDKKVDVLPEIGEIGAIEAQIAELEKKADKAYAKLRDKRAKAWVEDWESGDWTWDSDEFGAQRMPAEMIEKTKELAKEGKAFNAKPKHRRGLWHDLP